MTKERLKRAFVESYRLLCQNNKDVLDEFMKRTEEALSESNAGKRLAKAERDIHALEVKKNKLVDMRLEDTIDKETYDRSIWTCPARLSSCRKSVKACKMQPKPNLQCASVSPCSDRHLNRMRFWTLLTDIFLKV